MLQNHFFSLQNFRAKFDRVLKDSAITIASAFGGYQPRPTITEEEKRAVFGGRKPTVDLLCQRIAHGDYKRVVILAGAGKRPNSD